MIATATPTIRPTTIAEIRTQAEELLRAHFDEIATASTKRLTHLRPDWGKYEQLEAAGIVVALAAFTGDEMVGYAVTFVHTHLHYAGLVYAQNDVLFVAAPHRKSRLGLRLIAQTEHEVKERGARLLLWHAKEGTKLDALLPQLEYAIQDIIYSKELV